MQEEKKVEYIELIYDLIFVYFIGRNNELLHHVEGGFIHAGTYLNFLLGILVILQVWYLSTLFINRYGDHSARSYIGLFINMFLIYYMATGTRLDWSDYYMRYNIAWGLILINLAVQYFLQYLKNRKQKPWEIPFLQRHILFLVVQAAIIFGSIPLYRITGFPLSWISILAGFLFILFTRNVDALLPVNFEHLSERVMLFVVFTFGEMIISISAYFEGAFTLRTFFFSLMVFVIVAGLFISYGFLYDHILDRQKNTSGTAYMLLHVFLLLALCNLTAAFVYMRDPQVADIPKNILLVASFLAYFLFLLLLGAFSKEGEQLRKETVLGLIVLAVCFVAVMAFGYKNSMIGLIASALFIYASHLLLVYNYRKGKKQIHET